MATTTKITNSTGTTTTTIKIKNFTTIKIIKIMLTIPN
jgi:hypothetical protein